MDALAHAWLGRMPYRAAWALQHRLAAARAAGSIGDVMLLVEHPPVYTMGRGGMPEHVPSGPAHLREIGAEYIDVDRGGSVTFHGPGQLVAYPVVHLASVFPLAADPSRGDVLAHVRTLEQALIDTAAEYGVAAVRRPGYTGAWVGEEKLAAIGVKLAGGVTTHGAALNVSTDLGWFAEVVPCGIAGAGVTSLQALGVSPLPTLPEVGALLAEAFAKRTGRQAAVAGDPVMSIITEAQTVPV